MPCLLTCVCVEALAGRPRPAFDPRRRAQVKCIVAMDLGRIGESDIHSSFVCSPQSPKVGSYIPIARGIQRDSSGR